MKGTVILSCEDGDVRAVGAGYSARRFKGYIISLSKIRVNAPNHQNFPCSCEIFINEPGR